MRQFERRFIRTLRKFGDGPNLSNRNGFKTNPVMPETGGSCSTPQISCLVCFGLGTQHYWTNYKAPWMMTESTRESIPNISPLLPRAGTETIATVSGLDEQGLNNGICFPSS
jgi:hypothetical protein